MVVLLLAMTMLDEYTVNYKGQRKQKKVTFWSIFYKELTGGVWTWRVRRFVTRLPVDNNVIISSINIAN